MKVSGLFFFVFLLFPFALDAKVLMPAVFSDNMVLQQQSDVAVWGRANGKTVTVTADWLPEPLSAAVENGKWKLRLPTPAASFESHTLRISDKNSEVLIKGILIGEVWICSGQSNMEMTLRGFSQQPVNGAFEQVAKAACYRNKVRAVRVDRKEAEKPRESFRGQWTVPDPQSILGISATAWYFASSLSDMLNVPVGIITTSRSSSNIEAWMPKEILAGKFSYDVEAINSDPDIRGIYKCGLLYNGMLAPVMGYTAKGFLWYQGESNRNNSGIYASLMNEMVKNWRSRWGDEKDEMPFIFTQIAHYAYDNNVDGLDVPGLVDAQTAALKMIPNSAMVATTDVGEETCIHPSGKDVIGKRAAVEACRKAYAIDVPEASGMAVEKVDFAGSKVFVTFTNASYGLLPASKAVEGFELLGTDGKVYSAHAEVVKNKPVVVLSAPGLAEPVEVRYVYKNYMKGTLMNTLGYPAYPFRFAKP